MIKKILACLMYTSLIMTAPVFAAGTDSFNATSVINNDILGSGTLSALNSSVSVNTNGHSSITFVIPAGLIGTITPRITIDGTNYINTNVYALNSSIALSTITSAGTYIANVNGLNKFQLLVTSYTSGSVISTLRVGIGNNLINCISNCSGTFTPVSPKVKLAIGLGFATGIVNTTNQYPVEIIPTYTNAIITGFRAAGSTTDNGTTVFTVYKNGTSIGTLTFASGASSASVTLGSSVAISVNDILTLSCTTAGTISNVGIIAEGTQDTF